MMTRVMWRDERFKEAASTGDPSKEYNEGDHNLNSEIPQDEGNPEINLSSQETLSSSQSVEFVAGRDVNPMDREGVLLQDYYKFHQVPQEENKEVNKADGAVPSPSVIPSE